MYYIALPGYRFLINYLVLTIIRVNSSLPNVPFLHPLKTSENLWFSDVFRGYRNRALGKNGLLCTLTMHPYYGPKHCSKFITKTLE